MMSQVARRIIRRATAADYDAVMDLVKDTDLVDEYLPVMFHDYINDKRHALYVAEMPDDHKLVRKL